MAKSEIATVNNSEMNIVDYNAEQIQLIRDMFAKGTTDNEFKIFMELAKRYKLDPFKRQIWCVKYGDNPASIFTGRDGFLHIAHQNPNFQGIDTYCITKDGREVLICPDVKQLAGAVCYVKRSDWKEPLRQAVNFAEYNTGKSLWAKMPETMIKKVAESMALRKAFDITGLYAPEEFDQSYEQPQQTQQPIIETPKQVKSESKQQQPKAEPKEVSKEETEFFNKVKELSAMMNITEELTLKKLEEMGIKVTNLTDRNKFLNASDIVIKMIERMKAQKNYVKKLDEIVKETGFKKEELMKEIESRQFNLKSIDGINKAINYLESLKIPPEVVVEEETDLESLLNQTDKELEELAASLS